MSEWFTCREKLPQIWRRVIVKRHGSESFQYRALFSLKWSGDYYSAIEPTDQWMYFNE